MDVALTLDHLVRAAQYGGSVTANTKEAFDAIRWEDSRPKPTWAEMLTAWPTVKDIWDKKELREQRDKLLAESDYTQMPDSPLAATQKQAWATYRQALRDAPTTGIIPIVPA